MGMLPECMFVCYDIEPRDSGMLIVVRLSWSIVQSEVIFLFVATAATLRATRAL